MSKKYLTCLAGEKALEIIRDRGLCQEDVKIIAGAAGGPKWLVLSYLDRVLFSSWFKDRKKPLFLIGSSIGSWRFAALSQNDPVQALERLQAAYINQRYLSKPSPADVTEESRKILDSFLTEKRIDEILNHPYMRLNIMAVRSKWPVFMDNRFFLGLGLVGAALCNLVSRSWLKHFFERSLFFHPSDIPPFINMDGFHIQKNLLGQKNLKKALLASGSIPMVMSGVKNIPGAIQGTYRDGGIIDYHLDIPFTNGDNGIVLFPHYLDRVIPGWFDKKLSWRKPAPANMDNVILLSPSREFIERLPYKKIPDRNDFYRFKGRDNERIAYWNKVAKESEGLGEAFIDLVETGKIKAEIRPIA